LKTDLKLGQDLKLDLKTNQMIKQLIKQAQPQAQKSAQALKLSQVTQFAQAPTISPIFAEPVIPEFKLPTTSTIPIPFWFPSAKQKLKKKLEDKKLMQELALLPDFTARALDLEPEILTEAQVLKKMKKIKTGFGIRRSIKLLKGIPD